MAGRRGGGGGGEEETLSVCSRHMRVYIGQISVMRKVVHLSFHGVIDCAHGMASVGAVRG